MSLCFYIITWSMYLLTVFPWYGDKSIFKRKISTRVNHEKIKSSWKKCVSWNCYKFLSMTDIFRKLQADKSLFMVCLQKILRILSLATFHRVYSNSKKVPDLHWQNSSCNSQAACHTKPKHFSERFENILLAKYFRSVAVCQYVNFNVSVCVRLWTINSVFTCFSGCIILISFYFDFDFFVWWVDVRFIDFNK